MSSRGDPKFDLRERTAGENLWLWRMSQPESPEGWARRRMTCVEAARRLGVSYRAYVSMEDRGDRSSSPPAIGRELADVLAAVRPTTGMLCALARRRSGMNVVDLLRELGVTRQALWMWETTGAPRLRRHWVSRGFVFPEEESALQAPRDGVPVTAEYGEM